MDEVHFVVFELASDNRAVRLIALGILPIDGEVLAFHKTLFLEGSCKSLTVIVQGRMGYNLMLADANHFLCRSARAEDKAQCQTNRQNKQYPLHRLSSFLKVKKRNHLSSDTDKGEPVCRFAPRLLTFHPHCCSERLSKAR